MALGAAMVTGRPQAYCVVPGPGLLNSASALATAYGLGSPILALSGQIAGPAIGKMYGMLHELPDQLAILSQLTKHAEGIYDAEQAVTQIERIFSQLVSGPPRPVGLEVPMDVWNQSVDATELPLSIKSHNPAPDEGTIENAAKLLGQAKQPLIFVGGGAQAVTETVRELAEMIQAPVASARTGRGVVDARHPLAVSPVVAHRLWKTADVVLAIGSRLQPQQMDWGRDEALKIIHISLDPDELGRVGPPTVAIQADTREVMPRLLERTGAHNRKRTSRAEEVQEHRAIVAKKIAALEPQLSFFKSYTSRAAGGWYFC